MIVVPSKEKHSLVEHWADKYLDSGVSLQTDTDRLSDCNYKSDESHEENTHYSCSYLLPEMEVNPCFR